MTTIGPRDNGHYGESWDERYALRAAGENAGCICNLHCAPDDPEPFTADPACHYHSIAAAYPLDHSIPWNCPNYWDGCNCAAPFTQEPEAT